MVKAENQEPMKQFCAENRSSETSVRWNKHCNTKTRTLKR